LLCAETIEQKMKIIYVRALFIKHLKILKKG